jgi:heptosyltransferase I
VVAPISSICILRLSAIGDVCNCVAAVQAIQQKHPQAQLVWVVGKVERVLLDGLPGVELIVFDKSLGWKAYLQLRRDLKGRSFDVLLHMQVAFRANLAALFIRARRKIGFDWSRARELHALFMRERIPAQSEAHVLDGFFAFAQQLGVPDDALKNVSWRIPVPEADQAFADQLIPPGGKTLVISPAASKAERNWLPDRYAAMADFAAEKGYKVVLCGGPGRMDRELGDQILSFARADILDLIGKTSLKQLLALLGNAAVVIAPDTGPAHMANAQGTPVIGLYAHSNPKRTGPYRFQHWVVEAYHQNLIRQYGKTAAQLPWGTRVKGAAAMEDISVSSVQQMLARLS